MLKSWVFRSKRLTMSKGLLFANHPAGYCPAPGTFPSGKQLNKEPPSLAHSGYTCCPPPTTFESLLVCPEGGSGLNNPGAGLVLQLECRSRSECKSEESALTAVHPMFDSLILSVISFYKECRKRLE